MTSRFELSPPSYMKVVGQLFFENLLPPSSLSFFFLPTLSPRTLLLCTRVDRKSFSRELLKALVKTQLGPSGPVCMFVPEAFPLRFFEFGLRRSNTAVVRQGMRRWARRTPEADAKRSALAENARDPKSDLRKERKPFKTPS